MKIYEIRDRELDRRIGVLLYYEKEKSFIIELEPDLDEWTAPILFTSLVKKGILTMQRDVSGLWVKERVIPPGRQNIGSILKTHRLKEYDEMEFLVRSHGMCSQDSLFIRKLEGLPDFVKERMQRNLRDCVILDGNAIMCFFHDGTIRKVRLSDLPESAEMQKLRRNRPLFASGRITAGGYSVTFDGQIDIPAGELYLKGELIPLRPEDLLSLIQRNLLDTPEACELLECSRQNLSYLIRENRLAPIRKNLKGNLFLKGDVLCQKW